MNKILLFSLSLLLPLCAAATTQNIKVAGGEVDFLAIGRPSFIKIDGKGTSATGSLHLVDGKISGKIQFDLTSLNTGIDKRDEHMKTKYLEVEKYPKATLTLQSAQPIQGWSLQNPQLTNGDFTGTLTLHGVEHPVTGKFSVSKETGVDARFTVNLDDFKVEIPKFAGVTVAKDVQVTVKIAKLATE